jgi:3D (Asp-Asp-Asp) domain-containing protein
MSENKTYGKFTTLLLLNLIISIAIVSIIFFMNREIHNSNQEVGRFAVNTVARLSDLEDNHDDFEDAMIELNESIKDLQMDIFCLRWRITIHDVYRDISQAMREHQEKQKREKEQERLENIRLSKLRLKDAVIDPNSEHFVSVTAYNMGPLTAMGTQVRCGVIAASKDLIDVWGYGCTLVVYTKDSSGHVTKFGEYILEDRMHDKWSKKCDIYMPTRDKCMEFGIRKMWVAKKMD